MLYRHRRRRGPTARIGVPHLPVVRSLFEVSALGQLLEAEYGLTEVRCQLVQATIRDTYRVDSATSPFILSIYRHGQRTPEEISAEVEIIAAAHKEGVRVAPAIPRRSGERLLPITAPEVLRHAVLSPYIAGHQLSKTPDPEIVRRYGHAIARIHQAADALPGPLPRPRIDAAAMLDRPLAAFGLVVTHRPDIATELHEVVDALRPRIAKLPTEPPGFGLIHGDVIPSNAQVTPKGDVAVLDFDFCGDGWRVYDVATYLWEVGFWQTPWEAARAFLDGYQAVRPLAGWEAEALPVFETARGIVALGTPALHADTWGSAYLSDRLIERLLAGIRQSLAHIH